MLREHEDNMPGCSSACAGVDMRVSCDGAWISARLYWSPVEALGIWQYWRNESNGLYCRTWGRLHYFQMMLVTVQWLNSRKPVNFPTHYFREDFQPHPENECSLPLKNKLPTIQPVWYFVNLLLFEGRFENYESINNNVDFNGERSPVIDETNHTIAQIKRTNMAVSHLFRCSNAMDGGREPLKLIWRTTRRIATSIQ